MLKQTLNKGISTPIAIGIILILVVLVGGFTWWQYGEIRKEEAEFPEIEIPEKEEELDYKNFLSKMFPKKKFINFAKENCFKDEEEIFYCIDDIKEGFFTNVDKKEILLVIRYGYFFNDGKPSKAHVEGITHILLSVFDKKTKKILSEIAELVADGGELAFYNCKKRTFILFYGYSGGQGWVTGDTRLIKLDEGKFKTVWPDEEIWDHENLMVRPEEGKINIYKRKLVESDFVCPAECLFEFIFEPGGVIPNSAFIHSHNLYWNDNTCKFEERKFLSDKEVYEILREFAEKKTVRFNDIEAGKILLDALEFKNGEIKNRVQDIKISIENLSNEIQDAPDMRSLFTQQVKICVAESIIYDDIKSVLKYCGYKEAMEPISLTVVDDLTAAEQIIPYFIAGFAYYSENDYSKADYYYGQIKLHRAELEKYGYGDESYLELYNKICSKVKVKEVKISEKDKTADWKTRISEETEFLDVDEEITTDWETYTNKNYNYQLKLPKNWGRIGVYGGDFYPDINPYMDHYVPLGADDGSELIAVGHFRDTDKHEYSIDWYINFYINKEYQVKLIKTKYCDIVEIYISEINERLAASNKYTYLIEKDDYLFEIGFLNKNGITEQIIANLKFLD